MSEQVAKKIVRTEIGRVVSNKGDKTIVVLVERRHPHKLYKKYVTKSTKIHAHDETNQCNEGDTVRIRETRPLSKRKSWILDEVITAVAKA